MIRNEDCIIGMRSIPSRSVDLIVCDPPYGALKRGKVGWDEKLELGAMWAEFRRVIKKGGNILIFASGSFVAEVIASNPRWYRYNLVWVKDRPTDFFHATQKPMNAHEDILVFGASSKHTYNSGVERDEEVVKVKEETTSKCYNAIKRRVRRSARKNYPTTILRYPSVYKQVVASQKPEGLIRDLVRMYSSEGDVVLDPCAGSGTTAIVCRDEGREYIGFELNEKNYNIAVERLKN